MHDTRQVSMELRHLRYFVAVADTLNFGRASARLGISQPPLSRQIHDLEAELGVALFDRGKRGVRLTPAGAALLPQARRLLLDAAALSEGARHAAQGDVGAVRVGFISIVAYSVLPRVLPAFRRAHPGIRLHLREATSDVLIAAAHAGDLDVAIVLQRPDDPALRYVPLFAEPLMAALPTARRWPRRIDVAALAQEPFVLFPRAAGVPLYDAIVGSCRAAGFTPRVEQEALQMTTIVSLVAAGLGVALVPHSLHHVRRSGVVYRPLAAAAPPIEIGLVARADESSRPVATFVAAVTRAYVNGS
jgi:DNA-binding transcriptional LysR family regulator